jgi:uncharacterized protein (DUF2236 family)
MRDGLGLVETADLERQLEIVRAKAAGQAEGVFGPDSLIWQVDREALVFLGAGRALLLQLAHPWVATAIAEHSQALDDPISRFHRTFEIVFTLVFGTLDQALAASRRLHARHGSIGGRLSETLGPFAQGSAYQANEISAMLWVHATLTDTALLAHDLVLPPLSGAERARFYSEARLLGLLFGIPLEQQPPDWAAFARYSSTIMESDVLTVGSAAREIAARVLMGAGRVPVPRWYQALTASMLPARLRTAFGLPFGEDEQKRAARALHLIRHIYPALPSRLRYSAPYQEAVARLSGRSRPDALTRGLSRLWIGRPWMGE